ncbi:MAG: metallophosphoesterase [Saprospiraceae bacterium]
MKLSLPILLFAILFLSACANFRLHLEGEALEEAPSALGEPEFTVYLIGDAGDTEMGEVPPAVRLLGEKLKTAPENSATVFLGDNIYPDGLPPKHDPGRALAEYRLKVQLDILKDYKGKPYFIPGNHDWYQDEGRKGVERQEEFIEKYLGLGKDVWLPNHGCGDIETENFSKSVVGVFVDSEWYLMNWLKERELNEGCEIRSRQNFMFFFQEALKKNRRKNVVVFMHHPLHTNGGHGGRYSVKQHLFPLTDLNPRLYIPFPGVGTAFMFLRATVGSRTDTAHPLYREMKKIMEREARKNGSFIFAAGHEHNLQYFEIENQSYIVSGSGSKVDPVAKGRGLQFGYGKEPGFSILKFYPEGETWLEFWVAEGDGSKGRKLFSRQIKGKLPTFKTEKPDEYPIYESGVDSMATVLKPDLAGSALHRFFWGDHFRESYRASVKAPTLDLATWQGGVTPIKRGGGSQTNSLRVVDKEGKQWVLRDMLKDESRMVPYPFNKTFASGLFVDQFTASNPYVAFILPKLSDAAGIYHTNPHLYYIPKQPVLGDFNDTFGDRLYLVEERADGDWRDLPSFGNSKELVSTLDLLEEVQEDHGHRVDYRAVVRARLFDNMVGDWDRHDDNWRWATIKDENSGVTWYRPIPRDRDQPFSKWDGAVPAMVRIGTPFLKQLRPYDGKIANIKWLNYHSKYFDPTFLSGADWSVWEDEALKMKAAVTDEVIAQAMEDFPKEIKAIDAPWITPRLRQRRDDLPDIARRFYLLMARKVDVVGTEEHDHFTVERLDDERTRVRIYHSNKKGEKKGAPFFERTFLRSETKEVRLYGLGQEDHFTLTGNVDKGILVRCIGGLDNDTFDDQSSVAGLRKMTHFYDTKKDNQLLTGTEAADRTSDDPLLNTYDRRSWDHEHNFGMGIPLIGGNPDDGLAIGGAYVRTAYGFHRSPYASRHTISGQLAVETGSAELHYNAEFIRVIKRWDFLLDANFQGPTYTRNFYGFGNDSQNWLSGDQFDDDYIRVRQERYGIAPALRRNLASNLSIGLGGRIEMVRVEDTADRLVNKNNPQLFQSDFEANYFSSAEVQLNYFNADEPANPTTGLTFNLTAGLKKELQKGSGSFPYYRGHIGLYLGGRRLVLASKVGFSHVEEGFRFYDAAVLGARNNLRGYRNERFTGQTAVYHQNDLRLRLFNVNNRFMPFTLGVLAGYDYGRVWYNDEDSDNWHDAKGLGLWISPLDLTVLTISYFDSEDGGWFQFRGGFAF